MFVLKNKLKAILLGISIFGSFAMTGCGGSYFVSPDGSDENPGTINRPFKTVQKCASLVRPGETCWLREGIYRETIRPQVSGTDTELIKFAAYRNEEVTISGTEIVENWTSYRDSIYRSNVTLPVDGYSDTGFFANQVFVNGEMMLEARWPNTPRELLQPQLRGGGAIKKQSETTITIEDEEIPDLPEGWAGATVWTNEWFVSQTGTITGGRGGNLTAEMMSSWERPGFWFFLVGKLGLLDSEGEWFYDGKQNLYLWSLGGTTPDAVEVKQRNFAFDLSDRSNISINNINLFANTITTSDRSTGIVIDGINAKYVSHHMTLPPLPKSQQAPNSDDFLVLASHGHDTGIQLRGRGNIFKNSVIEWSSGNGVLLEGTNHTVENNIIANSNYRVSYAAPVRINGTGHKIIYNTITGAGRDAINIDWHTAGNDVRNVEIAHNDISRFGMLSTDLGAIYVCCYINLEGGSIHHNWIRDARAYSPFWGTRGIYLDIESFNSTIHHNVIWNITGGNHSFYLSARGPRGYHQIFNNIFLGPVKVDEYSEARNNIFAASENVDAGQKSHNLFADTDIGFWGSFTEESLSIPDFTLKPNSKAIDTGVVIPEITDNFVGEAPDIGAYERGADVWKAGSSLEYIFKTNK